MGGKGSGQASPPVSLPPLPDTSTFMPPTTIIPMAGAPAAPTLPEMPAPFQDPNAFDTTVQQYFQPSNATPEAEVDFKKKTGRGDTLLTTPDAWKDNPSLLVSTERPK